MGEWIEFAAIKARIPVMRVLQHYHLAAGLRRSGKDHYRGRCPLHVGEGRDAFHVDTAKQVFHCFSCGAGGTVLDLVAEVEGCDVRQAAEKLVSWSLVPVSARGGPMRCGETTVTKRKEVCPLQFRLRGVDSRHPYLRARGIWEQTADIFAIGFYGGPGLMSRRVVIPIHNELGELVAYCGRALDGGEPRYRFPGGFAKSEVLFNLHRARATGQEAVIVVEGFFDCLRVHQAGFPCVVALMGSALYDRQRRLLREDFRQVVLMLDGDEAGRRAGAVIAAQLAPCCRTRIVVLAAGTQPDQLSEAGIQQILAREGGRSESN